MGVNVLDDLLAQLRAVLAQYEQAEREAAQRLQELTQARLMQAGAVRGVEMAVDRLAKVSRPDASTGSATGATTVSGLPVASAGSAADCPPVSGLPSAADSADESGLGASMR